MSMLYGCYTVQTFYSCRHLFTDRCIKGREGVLHRVDTTLVKPVDWHSDYCSLLLKRCTTYIRLAERGNSLNQFSSFCWSQEFTNIVKDYAGARSPKWYAPNFDSAPALQCNCTSWTNGRIEVLITKLDDYPNSSPCCNKGELNHLESFDWSHQWV